MFGFIRPVKSELKVKEADRFQQVYCGLCHAIRARYGRFYTMFLSYDMTFYALVVGSGETPKAQTERRGCDAQPVTKRVCASPDDALAAFWFAANIGFAVFDAVLTRFIRFVRRYLPKI